MRPVVFFSRGRGRGHAIPDLAVIGELRRLAPVLDVQAVSYAVGLQTFLAKGEPAIDLGLPEENEFVQTILAAGQVLRRRAGCLVIAHEEPAALVAAKLADCKTVFMSHWFMPGQNIWSSSLRCADYVLFLADEGLFDEPPEVQGRVRYVGPLLRRLSCGPSDRYRARHELHIDQNDVLILVLPGSPAEIATPIGLLVLSAFDMMVLPKRRLVWLGGRDKVVLERLANGRSNVTILDTDWNVERWMVASDVVITKGTYNISLELGALGVPSISLSHGDNHIDDLFAQRSRTNVFKWAGDLTPNQLATEIEMCLARCRPEPDTGLLSNDNVARTAALIGGLLREDSLG